MQLARVDSQSFVISATQLTVPAGPNIGVVFPELNASLPVLEPADAYQLGDAMQRAARRAGYTPPPP